MVDDDHGAGSLIVAVITDWAFTPVGTVCVHHPSRPGGDHHGDIGREPRLAIEQRADEGDGASINAGHLALAWTANRQRDAVAECGALRAEPCRSAVTDLRRAEIGDEHRLT